MLILGFSALAQKYTISGYVSDTGSGEKLISATVYDAKSIKGTISNTYGFYSLTLPKGKIQFTISYVGYKTFVKEIDLQRDMKLNVNLDQTIELEEVVVIDNKVKEKVETPQVSMVELPIQKLKSLPVLFGEVDVMKTIQLLPGVQSGNEGTSGIYVRGGGPDQNLILLDGVPVYNPNHLFGFFSVFNNDAISNIKLLKGGFPSRYGGRLSSVIDIKMKEGNNKKLKATATIGLISSKLTVEGPIVNENTSFIISARRTYGDVLLQPIIASTGLIEGGLLTAGYFFQDFNAKVNHKFSDKSRLYLSAYTGKDKLYASFRELFSGESTKIKFGIEWGNLTSTLRWNYMFSDKLFSNLTLTYSNYTFQTPQEYTFKEQLNDGFNTEEYKMNFSSGIRDYGINYNFDFVPSPNQYIRFGFGNTYHIFKPGINTIHYKSLDASLNQDTLFGNSDIFANEYIAFAEDEFSLFHNFLKFNAGIRFNGFFVKNKYYHKLEPRLSMRARISNNISFKAAYSEMSQNIHLLTSSTIGLPTDLWVPTTLNVPPQYSKQLAGGVFFNIKDLVSVSLEGFYKTMENLIEYKDGADYFSQNVNWETKVEVGNGESYGGELFVEKKVGKITGWLGYTLSWSNRQFENINFGQPFSYKYDRRHDISIVGTYKLSDNIDLAMTWVYGTGNATTLSLQKYSVPSPWASGLNLIEIYNDKQNNNFGIDVNSSLADYYESRNSYRMPAYHRLDLSASFHKKLKRGTRTWNISVYNAYNRKNPMFLNLEYSNRLNKYNLVQYSFFPIIPSVSYRFEF